MSAADLAGAAVRLAAVTAAASDEALGRGWAWGAYAEEGARFAALRAAEELRALAVRIAAEREAAGNTLTQAQRILAQYHAAYRELQGALLGLDDEALNPAPAVGEWSAREALAHIAEADAGFLVCCGWSLGRHRAGDAAPSIPPNAYWEATLAAEADFAAALSGPLDGLCALHADLHRRILAELGGIADHEVDLPSRYWEPEPLPLRFRLHRLESHLRQHLVQIDGALAAIGRAPGEGRRLARLLYAALADAEGAAIGAETTLDTERAALAAALSARAEEVAAVLA